MKRHSSYRIWLLVLLNVTAAAQTRITDSLMQVVYNARTDKRRLEAVLDICTRNDLKSDTLRRYTRIAQELAGRVGADEQRGMAAYYLAWDYYLDSNNDSAKAVVDAALKYITPSATRFPKVYFKLSSFKATIYQGERNHTEALRILYPLLEKEQKDGNHLFTAQAMHQIAIVEGQQGQPAASIRWEQEALKVLPADDPASATILPTIYGTLGRSYARLNLLDTATTYNLKAIALFSSLDDLYNLPVTLQQQANIFIQQKKKQEAWHILSELSELDKRIGFSEGDLNYHLSFINYYLLAGEYDKAVALCNKKLYGNSAVTNPRIRLSYLHALGEAYKAKGDNLQYARTLEQTINAKDSFYKVNSAEAIATLQTQYEVQKKENTIIQQKLDLVGKNYFIYGSVGLLIFVVIVALLLFYGYKKREKLKLQLLLQKEKDGAALAVAKAEEKERKRIAADLHDNLGAYAASVVSNLEFIRPDTRDQGSAVAMQELRHNSLSIVSQLSDTIWVLNKDALSITSISDRIKVFVRRIQPSFPQIQLQVEEDIAQETVLPSFQAYHLFQMVQEATNNALRHSGGRQVDILIESHKQWRLTIRDDGHRMKDPSETGNGIRNMRSRAAECGWTIRWMPCDPGGTMVVISPEADS